MRLVTLPVLVILATVILGSSRDFHVLRAPSQDGGKIRGRYSGCPGPLAFVPGRDDGPVANCRESIVRPVCSVTPSTCCFRQCVYGATGLVTDLEKISETPDVRKRVAEALGSKLKLSIERSRQHGLRDDARSLDPLSLSSAFDRCVDGCTVNVTAAVRTSRMAQKR